MNGEFGVVVVVEIKSGMQQSQVEKKAVLVGSAE